MSDSEGDNSDSSNEFLVPADKIDLSSSFFVEKSVSKPNLKNPVKVAKVSESSDSDEDELEDIKAEDVDNVQSAELFSQILKNLERQKDFESLKEQELSSNDNPKGESSKSGGLASEINALLLQGESGVASSSFENHNVDDEDEKAEPSSEYTIPKEGVQITLPGTEVLLERKKKKTDIETLLKNKLNQRIRTTQILVHKVGLLWWLVYGFHLNRLANNPEILATSLSLISKNDYPKGRVDLVYLERITAWFKKSFPMNPTGEQKVLTTESLLERIREKKVYDYRELVILFVSLLRAIGLNCRLVVSLSPPRLKPKREQLFQNKKEEEEPKKGVNKEPIKGSNQEKSQNQKKKSADNKNEGKKEKKTEKIKKIIPENSPDARKNTQLEARKKAAAVLKKEKLEETKSDSSAKLRTRGKPTVKPKEEKSDENLTIAKKCMELRKKFSKTPNRVAEMVSTDSDEDLILTKTKKSTSRKAVKKNQIVEALNRSEMDDDSDEDFVPTKSRKSDGRQRVVQKKGKQESSSDSDFESDDEDDEDINKKSYVKKPSTKPKKAQNNRKLISSEEEDNTEAKRDGQDVWLEVYVESEESWISVNIPSGKIHCVKEIFKKASQPVLYVMAYNLGGTIKDVTRRYCPHWLTVTRKQRVDEKWWVESLKPWKESDSVMSKAEDEMLLQRELEQPLPKTVGECKGHPLYVLVRHLLKFEALYPPDVVPLGYLKNGEAIYSRHCVHTLRSRETWVKHARVVKPAQEAYKVVTSMPKFDKFSGTKVKGLPLDLFGKWQTTPYVPPEAKDGIVPRNEYGNVDLFQMCMLPKGTVYINLPALNRVARKLNIDCAPAVVGFNFGRMGALPAFEGYVVCSEFEDTLREAWEDEQVQAAKRAKEKREKKVYGNWRKLINGLLIRQRLAAKYSKDDVLEEDYSDQEVPVPVVKKRVQTKGKKGTTKEEKDSDQEESGPVVKKRVQTKGKKDTKQKEKATKYENEKDEEEEKPTKKTKLEKEEGPSEKEPLEKEPTAREQKSKPRGKKNSEVTVTNSARPKRKSAAKKYCDEEDSDADFEVKKPKRETRSQKNKIS